MYSINYLDVHKRNIFFSEDEDDFDFKYVPVNEFKHIVKSVKRKRTKDAAKKECISLAKQQIDRQTTLNDDHNDKTENHISKNSKVRLGKNNLLTIPEETSTLPSSDSSKSKSTCRNYRKLPLEMAGESCYKFLHPVTQDSSTDLSPTNKTNKALEHRFNEIFLQPDLNATYQVLMIQRKILDILDEISHRLNKIPLPDGENDLQRRQQRIVEFSIRFSRNYLYDLSRQITDIRRHLNVVLENSGVKFSKRGLLFQRQTIEQKLVVVHQLLLNALSVYCKHIPSSTLKGQPGKLKDILEMVIDVRDICVKMNLTPEYMGFGESDELPLGKDTEDKCAAILSKISSNLDNETHLINQTADSITSALMSLKKRNQKRIQSMYKYNKNALLSRKQRMRKSGGIYQKNKKSLYGIANKNRNVNENISPVKSKVEGVVRNNLSKIRVPPKEDEIKTMMDMIEMDTDDESNTESPNPVTGIVVTDPHKLLMKKFSNKLKSNTNSKIDHKFTNQELLNAVPLISDLMSIIEEKKNQMSSKRDSLEKKTKRSDPENMRLIYLKEECDVARLNDVSCQVSCNENADNNEDNRFFLSIDEAAKNNLLEYRSAFKSYLQSNPMYSNSTKNKPWELVSWVAEKLIDEMIVDVSKEFEIDDIIKRMFELEFQEF